jgi:hypothetical protein
LRLVRSTTIVIGAVLAIFAAIGLPRTLALRHRTAQELRVTEKLSVVLVDNPEVVWNTDLHPYGFPDGAFDSPYLEYTAPATVAMSDSIAAVAFHKSSYAGNQLVQDVHLVTLSIGNGSVVKNIQWSEQQPPGLAPGIFCCTRDDEFYAPSDGWLLIKDGEVVGKQKSNPVGPNTQKVNVNLGNSNRATTVEIVHEDGSKSRLRTACGLVHTFFLSKDRFVMVGCNALSVVGMDAQVLFSDSFPDKGLMFGGRSKNGKKFVVSVTAYHQGDPPILTNEWMVIYDTDQRGAVFALKSDPLPYQQSQSALSADGGRLLLGSGGHIKLVNVHK